MTRRGTRPWIARPLVRVRRAHGRDAVAIYYGNPVAHNLGLMTHALPFARMLATKNVYSASSADQLPQMLAALRMFGHLGLIPVPDLDRTDHFLIFGANPLVSNGSLMTAPDMRSRLHAIRARGGRVVVVDPRRTETAAIADDTCRRAAGDRSRCCSQPCCTSFSPKASYERGGSRDARRTSRRSRNSSASCRRNVSRAGTGVAADVTRRLAREFASTPKAACYGRVGLCTQRYGTLASWLVQALNLVTGHLDEVGGVMLTTPAVDAIAVLSRVGLRGTYDRWRSRVRQLPEFAGDLPVASLADEIETAGAGQVRALVTIAGNPVLRRPTAVVSIARWGRSNTSCRSTAR